MDRNASSERSHTVTADLGGKGQQKGSQNGVIEKQVVSRYVAELQVHIFDKEKIIIWKVILKMKSSSFCKYYASASESVCRKP